MNARQHSIIHDHPWLSFLVVATIFIFAAWLFFGAHGPFSATSSKPIIQVDKPVRFRTPTPLIPARQALSIARETGVLPSEVVYEGRAYRLQLFPLHSALLCVTTTSCAYLRVGDQRVLLGNDRAAVAKLRRIAAEGTRRP